ncbi:hypothetical protein LPJ74_000581, partial [Coemansia sp. RSA 1843]
QAIASYSHPVASTLSSSATAPGSTPSGPELHPIQTSGIAPQQHHHIFGGKQIHGDARAMDQQHSYTAEAYAVHEHGEYPDHHMYRSLPPYRQQQKQQQQQQQQQQRHYYPPHRPWSPHHRAQHHYSPTHPGHAFANETRYSPYNRQVDTPRDGRQHASSSSSSSGVRLNNLVGASSAESGITSPPEQHSFRHPPHVVSRTVAHQISPDPMQRYQKHPAQQQQVYASMPPADSATVATLPPISQSQAGGSGGSRFGQHSQQHGLQKSQFVKSPSPEKKLNLPPFGAIHVRDRELAGSPSGVEGSREAALARETPSPAPQRRMMAVHSLLISDSSSPERTNGSSS